MRRLIAVVIIGVVLTIALIILKKKENLPVQETIAPGNHAGWMSDNWIIIIDLPVWKIIGQTE